MKNLDLVFCLSRFSHFFPIALCLVAEETQNRRKFIIIIIFPVWIFCFTWFLVLECNALRICYMRLTLKNYVSHFFLVSKVAHEMSAWLLYMSLTMLGWTVTSFDFCVMRSYHVFLSVFGLPSLWLLKRLGENGKREYLPHMSLTWGCIRLGLDGGLLF